MISVKELKKLCTDISVLYIEDEDVLRENMDLYLNKIFNKVTIVSDGDIGLQEYKKSTFDLIITDIYMPNMSGTLMLKEILKINPTQKVIVVTAMTNAIEELKAMNIKNSSILVKPVEHNNFIKCIYQVLTQ